MLVNSNRLSASQNNANWLRRYYFTRFAFSAVWVAVACSVAISVPVLAAVMLVLYPAWDALANAVDAQRSGGLLQNLSQLLNFFVSVATAIGVGFALSGSINSVLLIYGIWAAFSGLFQLTTAIGRRKTYGAQWAMMLSGAQSLLAGAFMIKGAQGVEPVSIANIAPYAAFGAFYFLVSAISLTVGESRKRRPRAA